jgi:hypothetical protein
MADVDIFDKHGKLLFTYPVTIHGLNYAPTEREFLEAGLRCAKDDCLVPNDEIKSLTAKLRRA